MNPRISLSNFLYYLVNMLIGILGLIIGYLCLMALLALFGLLPNWLEASFEVPIQLKNPEKFYTPTDLDDRFYSTHIEVKNATLEVKPQQQSWSQTLAYLHAAVYLFFFLGILYFLSKMLDSFRISQPFLRKNIIYLRWMGMLTIGLGLYTFFVRLVISSIFRDKFSVAHANLIDTPSFWDINFVLLFLGMVFLTLTQAFNIGAKLQEFEDQTV